MRAVLQFHSLARVIACQQAARIALKNGTNDTVSAPAPRAPAPAQARPPVNTVAFYRKHTEKLLRRYLYASMLIGRTPPSSPNPSCAVSPPAAAPRHSKIPSFSYWIWRSASTSYPTSTAKSSAAS